MFFERPGTGECAILVHLDLRSEQDNNNPREFEELVLAAGGDPVEFVTGLRDNPHPKLFIGTGKLEEVQALVVEHKAEVVIFNHSLSPSQERNLEREFKCRVLDRTGLILDIFAQRARTHEGKLQVELAQLQHMSTRLVRGWTHLERQKGGIGLRGPGETQLETDRRLLRVRMQSIRKKLEKVQRQREQGRRGRRRAEIPTVSLVGYTNAGKSTLFNRMTDSDVFAANQLFATLDPTMRKVSLPKVGEVVLADTVGFISHLPHGLVNAFRATLEEASMADLLIHVVDVSSEDRPQVIAEVNEVLHEIGAAEIPVLMVYNKTDLLENMPARVDVDADGNPVVVWVSAKTGEGLAELSDAIASLLAGDLFHERVCVPPRFGRLRAALYNRGAVVSETHGDNGESVLEVRMPVLDWQRLLNGSEISERELVHLPVN